MVKPEVGSQEPRKALRAYPNNPHGRDGTSRQQPKERGGANFGNIGDDERHRDAPRMVPSLRVAVE